MVDVLELFSAIFYKGAQWAKFPMGRNFKIQNHRILDICLEIISTKFGWSRSKINKIKTRDILLIKPIYKLWKMVQWRHPVLNFMFRFCQQCFHEISCQLLEHVEQSNRYNYILGITRFFLSVCQKMWMKLTLHTYSLGVETGYPDTKGKFYGG